MTDSKYLTWKKVIKDNPDLSLARQRLHFFNPRTDPMQIKAVIER